MILSARHLPSAQLDGKTSGEIDWHERALDNANRKQ